MPTSIDRGSLRLGRTLIAVSLLLPSGPTFADSVTVDDWVARLTVFYAAVLFMIVVDGIALFYILKVLRRKSGGTA